MYRVATGIAVQWYVYSRNRRKVEICSVAKCWLSPWHDIGSWTLCCGSLTILQINHFLSVCWGFTLVYTDQNQTQLSVDFRNDSIHRCYCNSGYKVYTSFITELPSQINGLRQSSVVVDPLKCRILFGNMKNTPAILLERSSKAFR